MIAAQDCLGSLSLGTVGKRWDWRRKSNVCDPRVFLARQREQRSERFRGVTTQHHSPSQAQHRGLSTIFRSPSTRISTRRRVHKRSAKAYAKPNISISLRLSSSRGSGLTCLSLRCSRCNSLRSGRLGWRKLRPIIVNACAKEGEENEGTDCIKLQNPPRSHWPRSF